MGVATGLGRCGQGWVGVVTGGVGVATGLHATEWFLLVHKQGGPCRWQVLEVTLEQEHVWSQGSCLFLRATYEDLVYGASP